jgi:ribose/xylose/arabinose/galactoside ABC-type transport system permease subunit
VAIGSLNGLVTTYGRVPSLIVTLGMLNVVRGLTLLLTGAVPILLWTRTVSDPNLDSFFYLGQGYIFESIPTLVVVFALVAFFGYLVHQRTILGFRMRAVGGNPVAARVAGMNARRIKILAFSISGLLAGVGGILHVAFNNNVQGITGTGLELDVIAAVIIGGTSLRGGEGTIAGTVIGVVLIGILRNGLVLWLVSPFAQMVIIGAVIIGAVLIDMWTRARRR